MAYGPPQRFRRPAAQRAARNPERRFESCRPTTVAAGTKSVLGGTFSKPWNSLQQHVFLVYGQVSAPPPPLMVVTAGVGHLFVHEKR